MMLRLSPNSVIVLDRRRTILALLSMGIANTADVASILEDENNVRIADQEFREARYSAVSKQSWRRFARTSAQTTHDTGQSRKASASGWIGSALEYYDFFI